MALYLFYIIPICAAIAFLASLTVFFQPAEQRYLKLFSMFLFVNGMAETFSNYLAVQHVDNTFFTSLVTIIAFTFYLFLLREIIRGKTAKRVLLFLLLIYPLIALVNILFFQKSGFHTVTYGLGCLLIVGCCIYYFL
ncbi:MAG TPA: hypothetical protein VKQ52_16030, partial [Puia sp.]|nr:hypothetical protein [Puia sp.]